MDGGLKLGLLDILSLAGLAAVVQGGDQSESIETGANIVGIGPVRGQRRSCPASR